MNYPCSSSCRNCRPGIPCASMSRWLAEDADELSKAEGLDLLHQRIRKRLARRPARFVRMIPDHLGGGFVELDEERSA